MSECGILYSNENKWPTATYNMDELHQHNEKEVQYKTLLDSIR